MATATQAKATIPAAKPKIKLLDLCCKAGGCSKGYADAALQMGIEIEITGVDIEPQPRYPYKFIQADALDFLKKNGHEYTHIHASPPCQPYSNATAPFRKSGKVYRDNLLQLREAMKQTGKPGIIENVPTSPVVPHVVLRGDMFGLLVLKKRNFECVNWSFLNPPTLPPIQGSVKNGDYAQVIGKGQKKGRGYANKPFKIHGTVNQQWSIAMGIDWMKNEELAEAVPPAYTNFIGKQFLLTQPKPTIPAAKKPKAANLVAQLQLSIPTATDKTNYTEGKLSEGYPGNKSQAYQRIINQIPPHEVFYSGFAGKCTIATKKKPATRNIVTDLYDAVLPYWKQHKHIHALHENFFAFIEQITWSKTMGQQWCIYLDPPYLKEARKSGKDIYTHELTPEQHEQLIKAVLHISNVSHTHILISHPPVPLYETLLQHGWRKITYEAPTHRGTYTDALYMNYPEPEQLHEYTYLGTDFIQRQQIKRKKTALAKKLAKLPALERNAVLDYLHNYFTKQ